MQMSPLTMLIVMALCVACGLLFGFVVGLDWRDYQARTERRKAEYASREIAKLAAYTVNGERRLFVVRNGRRL